MALINRRRDENRAITKVPWDVGSDTLVLGATSESDATSVAPVFAAVRLLCDTIATLPIKAYRDVGGDRVPMVNPPQLIQNLRSDGRMTVWLTEAVMSLALRGNAVGLMTSFDGFGHPTAIEWMSMDDIYVHDRRWFWRGRPINRADLLHIPWMTAPGKTLGLSPIEVYASTSGIALKAQRFGAKWFDNGGVPPGTFRNEAQIISAEEAETISQRLVRSIQKGRPLVHGKDWEYTPVSVPPEHVQFIEAQKLTATQIAAIYGIPPERIGGESGDSMTYANVEQQALDFVTFAMRPWLVRIENAISAVLPERQYVKFNADALVRADIKTRHEVHKISREIGLRNLDEIRALEDLPPLPGGQGTDYAPPKAPQPATPQASDDGTDDERSTHLSVIHNGGRK